MSAPERPDVLASISSTIYSALTAAHAVCTHTSAAIYTRCASFTSSALSPDGRAKVSSAAADIPRAVSDDPVKFALAWGAGASVFAAGLVMTPRAGLLLQLRNADRIRAFVFGCAGVTASGAAATASSLCVMQQTSNFTSTLRTFAHTPSSENAFVWIWPSLPAPEVALLCGALSLLTFRACGGRPRYLLPSDLCVRPLLPALHSLLTTRDTSAPSLNNCNTSVHAGSRPVLPRHWSRLPCHLRL